MSTPESRQIIRNVATLDLRTTAESTFANIKQIENVAMVIYSAETAPLFARLNVNNVANAVEVPVDASIFTGQATLGSKSFQNQQKPLSWMITGQLFVDADLSAEELDRGLESLVVCGQLLCPENLAGTLQSKLKHMTGQFDTYTAHAITASGKVTLTEHYLRELPDHSNLFVQGKLIATQPLPADLIDQKLDKLQVQGKVICAEENSRLQGKMQSGISGQVVIVPAGYDVVDRTLILDAGLLETFEARKLYCTGMVRFEDDVTPELAEIAIGKLAVSGLLLAPASLRKTLARKCDLLQTEAIFYTGKLWLIENEEKLDQRWFETLKGETTLVVTGEAELDAALDSTILGNRLQRVHNKGEISGTAAQLAALRALAGVNTGEWNESSDATAQAAEATDGNVLGNAAYLRL